MKSNKKKRELIVGDLVYHLLYGREWVAIVLSFGVVDVLTQKDVTLVHIQPGSEYENFFKKTTIKHRITDNLGYVSHHWLRLLEETPNREK